MESPEGLRSEMQIHFSYEILILIECRVGRWALNPAEGRKTAGTFRECAGARPLSFPLIAPRMAIFSSARNRSDP